MSCGEAWERVSPSLGYWVRLGDTVLGGLGDAEPGTSPALSSSSGPTPNGDSSAMTTVGAFIRCLKILRVTVVLSHIMEVIGSWGMTGHRFNSSSTW